MGGGKRTRQRTLQKKFRTPPKELLCAESWISVQENQPRRVESVPDEGVQTRFWEGWSFVRLSSLLLFPPPHGNL